MQHIRGYRVLKCGQFFTVYSLETLFHLQGFATFWWANYLCADANKRFQRMLLEKWVINQNSGRILKKIDQVGPLNLWALGIQFRKKKKNVRLESELDVCPIFVTRFMK